MRHSPGQTTDLIAPRSGDNPYQSPLQECEPEHAAAAQISSTARTCGLALLIGVLAGLSGELSDLAYTGLVHPAVRIRLPAVINNAVRMLCHYSSGAVICIGFLWLARGRLPSPKESTITIAVVGAAMLFADGLAWLCFAERSPAAETFGILLYAGLKTALIAAVLCWRLRIPCTRLRLFILPAIGAVACFLAAFFTSPLPLSFFFAWSVVTALQLPILLATETKPRSRNEYLPKTLDNPQ